MLSNDKHKALIKNIVQRMWFTDDTDEIFGEKLDKRRNGHFAEQDSENQKQR